MFKWNSKSTTYKPQIKHVKQTIQDISLLEDDRFYRSECLCKKSKESSNKAHLLNNQRVITSKQGKVTPSLQLAHFSTLQNMIKQNNNPRKK